MRRVLLWVMDSVGVGELPDAAEYGDQGADTLGNLAQVVGGLNLPNLEALGLGSIHSILGVEPVKSPQAAWGRMAEASRGKDTTTGHWELAGIVSEQPFPTYPQGFPDQILKAFEEQTGRGILGNLPASGTEIIQQLGEEHLKTGKWIVYTSADSVFQVAAHEDVIPIPELYRACQIAREILVGEHGVGRVIARPFTGAPGAFERTPRRKDFSLEPTGRTILDHVSQRLPVVGIGKIPDIFAGRGITRELPSKSNQQTAQAIRDALEETREGLIFANSVDFDMLYGHRNDAQGYARALEELDQELPSVIERMRPGDILILTADHGCDPTNSSTDHSREYVPVLIYGPSLPPVALGTRSSFTDVAATISDWLGLGEFSVGESMLLRIHNLPS